MANDLLDYCAMCGFDNSKIKAWLAWLNLTEQDHALATRLHDEVIVPHLPRILARLNAKLSKHQDFALEMAKMDQQQLNEALSDWLLDLGLRFDAPAYFNRRLQVGLFLALEGAPIRLYPSCYCLLQQLLLDFVPRTIRENHQAYDALARFILQITALDLSLNIEASHRVRLHTLQLSVATLQTERVELRRKAATDDLTRLPNHGETMEALKSWMKTAAQEHFPLTLIMADIDHFKQVNDTHGHLVGDVVLQHVAERLQSAMREQDLVGRYGGEEFLVILPKTELALAKTIADRIRCLVAQTPIHTNGLDIPITISLGIAAHRENDDLSSLIGRADTAMYAAKKGGRNRIAEEPTGLT